LLARSDHSQPPSPYYSVHSYYHADGNPLRSNSSKICSRRAAGVFTRPSTSVFKIVSAVVVINVVIINLRHL
jgi:hypothetical protein